jgi:SAM-dependent methyltransferase
MHPPPAESARCPICTQGTFVRGRIATGRRLLRCDACGVQTWRDWPPPDAEPYDATYWHSPDPARGYPNYAALAAVQATTHRARLAALRRHLRGARINPPRLLDVGCGPGHFLAAARAAGWHAVGLDPSEYAVSTAHRRTGLDVRHAPLTSHALPAGPFDAVTLWDVLEHLPDPVDALACAAQALHPGGVLAVSTGDVNSAFARACGARWHLYRYPEHLWFFTPASLRTLLTRTGFRLLQSRYEGVHYPAGHIWRRAFAMLSPALASRLAGGWLDAVPLPFTVGDVVAVLARRTAG